jgi:hypothetical protein
MLISIAVALCYIPTNRAQRSFLTAS